MNFYSIILVLKLEIILIIFINGDENKENKSNDNILL